MKLIKNTYNLDYVKSRYIKKEQEALIKMYPNKNTTDNYILYIESELWFPYLTENIKANINFIYKDDIKIYKTKLRTPYPNKTITTISMINGRKVCDLGLPILFNSYEDLKKLKNILIKWEIDVINSEDIKEKFYIQILYNVDFKYVEGKKIYSLYSKDSLPQCYENNDLLIKYIEEFDKVILIKNSGKDAFNIEYLKGAEKGKKLIQEEAFTTIIENMGMKEFIDTAEHNKNFNIFSYYAEEILEPNIIAENIPH